MNSRERSRFGKNFLTLAIGTAMARGTGFLRELATAAFVGAGPAMDRFVVAFTVPTLFRRILGEEMVERALMPAIKGAHSRGETRRAWAMTWQLFFGMVGALLVIWAILWLRAEALARLIGPGIIEKEGGAILIPLIRLILPFLVIIGIAAYVGGILLYTESVRIYSLAPIGLSLGVILSLAVKGSDAGARALAMGFLLGGGLQLGALVVAFLSPGYRRRHQVSWGIRDGLTAREAKAIFVQSLWVFLQSVAQKSAEVVDRRLASGLGAGSVAALWYAARLVQLPEAVVGLAAGRAGVAAMTEKHAKGHTRELARLVHHAVERTLRVIAPVAAFCCVASGEITSLVYRRGEFGGIEAQAAAWAFRFYSLGLPGLALTSVLSRYHAVCARNGFTLGVAVFSAVVNIILNYVLVRTSLVHGGIALATSIAFSAGTVILWWGFIHGTPVANHGENVHISLRILFLSACFGVILIPFRVWAAGWRIPEWELLHLPSLVRVVFLGLVAFVLHRLLTRIGSIQ